MRKRGNNTSRAESIEGQIAQLRDLDLTGLRTCWHNEFGRTAPKHLTRFLLFRVLAYKVQADRYGDLDAGTVKVLEQAGRSERQEAAVAKNLAACWLACPNVQGNGEVAAPRDIPTLL
jgi:hypothetical protein